MLHRIQFTILIILLIGIFNKIYSKKSPNNGLLIDTVTHLKNQNGRQLSYKTIINGDDNYTIEIKTFYIYDKNYLTHDWVSDVNRVVISQTLTFKYKGSSIAVKNFDVRKWIVKKFNKKVNFLDDVIREVGFVKGSKGGFYKIYGFGGCNSCSEYLGYYSMTGNLLYKIYTSRMDNYSYLFGNFDQVMAKYGIPDSLLKSNSINVVSVFPPQYSGDNDKSSIR
ncbi:hypothetical protein [Mucilaginibacter sp.]